MNYPLLNIFWTILVIFLWVIWFWILITVFIDIFRSPDLSGWGQGPVVPVRAVHPADRRAGLPDCPRRHDERAIGLVGPATGPGPGCTEVKRLDRVSGDRAELARVRSRGLPGTEGAACQER